MKLGIGIGFCFGDGVAFNPSQLALTGWYRGSYGGVPWVGTASGGVSSARSLVGGTAAAVGTAVNGFTPANFNGTTHNLIDGVVQASAYLSNTAYRVGGLINLTATDAPAGNIFDNRGIVTEGGGNWGIVANNAGVHCYHRDAGGIKTASSAAAVALAGWHAFDVLYNGTTLTVSIDAVAGTPVSAATLLSVAATFRVGTNYANAAAGRFSGLIQEVIVSNITLIDTTPTHFKNYFNARYALAL